MRNPNRRDPANKKRSPNYKNVTKEQLDRWFKQPWKLKIGRSCFTCQFRGKRRSSFVRCTHYTGSTPQGEIWDKATCERWKLTRDKRRLAHFERFVDTKKIADRPGERNYYYCFKYI